MQKPRLLSHGQSWKCCWPFFPSFSLASSSKWFGHLDYAQILRLGLQFLSAVDTRNSYLYFIDTELHMCHPLNKFHTCILFTSFLSILPLRCPSCPHLAKACIYLEVHFMYNILLAASSNPLKWIQCNLFCCFKANYFVFHFGGEQSPFYMFAKHVYFAVGNTIVGAKHEE